MTPPRWAGDAAAILALVGLAAWAVSPALVDGGLVGGGEQPDWTGSLWAMWWVGHAVTTGRSPLVAADDFFPTGQAPAAWYNLLDGALGAPLVGLLGPERGYDVACLVALATAGLGAYALARASRAGPAGALVAGAAVTASPWLLLELTQGRIAQVLVLAPLLALAGLVRVRDGAGLGVAALAGLAVAASALTYWFAGLFVALGAGALLAAPGAAPRRAAARGFAAAALVAGLLCLPFAVPLAVDFAAQPGVARAVPEALDHGEWGRGSFGLNVAIARAAGVAWPVYTGPADPVDLRLPLSVVILAVVGAALPADGPRRGRWLALLGLGWALMLGPWPRNPAGGLLPVPLPWLALHELLPFFDRLWWPVRASVLAVPAVGLLAARGVGAVTGRLPARARWPAAGGLAVLVLLEIGVAGAYLPVTRGPAPPLERALYAGLDGALVTTPVLGRSSHGRHVLWAQAAHGLPISGGLGDHLPEHVPDAHRAYVETNGLLAALHAVSQGVAAPAEVTPADVQALLDDGFRWVVVDPVAYRPGREGAWARAFRQVLEPVWGRETHASGRAAAWRITPIDAPVTLPAIAPVEADLPPETPFSAPVRHGGPPHGSARGGPVKGRGRP